MVYDHKDPSLESTVYHGHAQSWRGGEEGGKKKKERERSKKDW